MATATVRQIIKIDEDLCTGCGECIPACPEGALRIIDGKARLVADVLCDGLGACLGNCPEGALTVEERPAEAFDEAAVEAHQEAGPGRASGPHVDPLLATRGQNRVPVPKKKGENTMTTPTVARVHAHDHATGGCPGARMRVFTPPEAEPGVQQGKRPSQLRQWPVQLHLVSPAAPYFEGVDVLLVADCVAYAMGDFHKEYLQGNSLAIACPKLDEGQDLYQQKLRALIEEAKINTLTVLTMEVPCCLGLLELARTAAQAANRKVPLKSVVVGIQGDVLSEEWV